jgi:phosphopantothenoylcysteine decarboxylase/phosphopantothenate--cysteine ligase
MGHIELARWADHVLIAPATANTLARLAQGFADDLLSTLCLATAAPLYVAPAMNTLMWQHAATRSNCQLLVERGVTMLGPADGLQACGETGAGRMLEPETIRDLLLHRIRTAGQPLPQLPAGISPSFEAPLTPENAANQPHAGASPAPPIAGLHIVITAGPTREPIDPVRFISNHSSGKMGYALAAAAADRQARVTLISGPVQLATPPQVQRIDVETAEAMHAAVLRSVVDADIFISVAAVADYRVAEVAPEKIKKNDAEMNLQLVRNPDILKAVAALPARPFCVGFAAETESVEAHARAKLHTKKLDMIAANQVAQADNPVFGSDTNSLDVYWGDTGHARILPAPKTQVAAELLDLVAERLALQAAAPA